MLSTFGWITSFKHINMKANKQSSGFRCIWEMLNAILLTVRSLILGTVYNASKRSRNPIILTWFSRIVGLTLLHPGSKWLLKIFVRLKRHLRAQFGRQDHFRSRCNLTYSQACGHWGDSTTNWGGSGCYSCHGRGSRSTCSLLLQPFLKCKC